MCGACPVDLRGSRGPRGRPDPGTDGFSAKSIQIQNTPMLNPPLATAEFYLELQGPREMALEVVPGADFLRNLMCGAGTVDLRGSPGPPRPRKRRIFSQIPNPPLLNPPEMALEVVSGADFFVQIDVRSGPGRSEGVPGSISWLKPRNTSRNGLRIGLRG